MKKTLFSTTFHIQQKFVTYATPIFLLTASKHFVMSRNKFRLLDGMKNFFQVKSQKKNIHLKKTVVIASIFNTKRYQGVFDLKFFGTLLS